MSSAMDLVDIAVSKKRQGLFKQAIQFYEKALELDRQSSIIYTSLAKSLYLDKQRDRAVISYLMGLKISIIEYAQKISLDSDSVKRESIQRELVSLFFSTNRHLAHAYIDLCETSIENLILNIADEEPYLSEAKIRNIVNYEILNYRFGLAGGGIDAEPDYHDIQNDINFVQIYQNYGETVAIRHIDWNEIAKILE